MVQQADASGDEKGRSEKRARYLKVTVVTTEGEATAVERNGRRVIVPTDEVRDGKVAKSVFDAGMQYGEEWEKAVTGNAIDADRLAVALRAEHIWTWRDLLSRMNDVRRIARHQLAGKNKTNENLKTVVRNLRDYARTKR